MSTNDTKDETRSGSAVAGVTAKVVNELQKASRIPGCFYEWEGEVRWSYTSKGHDYEGEQERRERAFQRMKTTVEALYEDWTVERGVDHDGEINATISPSR